MHTLKMVGCCLTLVSCEFSVESEFLLTTLKLQTTNNNQINLTVDLAYFKFLFFSQNNQFFIKNFVFFKMICDIIWMEGGGC